MNAFEISQIIINENPRKSPSAPPNSDTNDSIVKTPTQLQRNLNPTVVGGWT